MGQTPKYALRWPEPTNPADGPLGFQNLATDVETALLSPPAASLPSSPVNGQIARYLVSANGPVWTFVYVAASTAPRWHFVGGSELLYRMQSPAGPFGTPGSWQDAGRTFTLTGAPAGDYRCQIGAYGSGSVATAQVVIGLKVNGVSPAPTDYTKTIMAQPPGAAYLWAGQATNVFDYAGLPAACPFGWIGAVNTGTLTLTEAFARFTPIRVS